MPKFSVIIPVYNAEKYLKRCLDSLLDTSYIDFEIICVNDGSFDNSLSILEQYAENEHISIINQSNAGVSCARNTGLDYSSGEYVWFVDADDYVEQNSLELLSKEIELYKHPSIIIFQIITEYYKHGNMVNKEFGNPVNDLFIDKEKFAKDFFSLPLSNSVWNKIFKKSIIRNIRFNEKMTLAEDVMFCNEVYSNINNILITHLILYHYCRDAKEFKHYKDEDMGVENSFKRSELLFDKLRLVGIDEISLQTELNHDLVNTVYIKFATIVYSNLSNEEKKKLLNIICQSPKLLNALNSIEYRSINERIVSLFSQIPFKNLRYILLVFLFDFRWLLKQRKM